MSHPDMPHLEPSPALQLFPWHVGDPPPWWIFEAIRDFERDKRVAVAVAVLDAHIAAVEGQMASYRARIDCMKTIREIVSPMAKAR